MSETQYPQSEKLNAEGSQWGTLNEFMEFLGSKGVQLMRWVEREWEETCQGSILTDCIDGFYARANLDGDLEATKNTCSTCHGTGVVTKTFKGYEPVSLANDNLVYAFLDVDPAALEAERRAMLASLGA